MLPNPVLQQQIVGVGACSDRTRAHTSREGAGGNQNSSSTQIGETRCCQMSFLALPDLPLPTPTTPRGSSRAGHEEETAYETSFLGCQILTRGDSVSRAINICTIVQGSGKRDHKQSKHCFTSRHKVDLVVPKLFPACSLFQPGHAPPAMNARASAVSDFRALIFFLA